MLHQYAAIPWYVEATDYEQFRRNALDADDFFDSFSQWVQVACEHERRAESNGVPIIRICMRWPEFDRWCQGFGGQNDAAGRSRFADQKANQIVNGCK